MKINTRFLIAESLLVLSILWACNDVSAQTEVYKSGKERASQSVSIQSMTEPRLTAPALTVPQSKPKLKSPEKTLPRELLLGGSDRGGGDAKMIRSLIMENKREALIQKSLAFFDGKSSTTIDGALYWIVNHKKLNFQKSKHQEMLDVMIQKGFAQDISSIRFIRSSRCVDAKGIERTAVASMNSPRSPICINIERFVNEFGPYIQDSDTLGLVMHELAHHYGFDDADHSFAAAVANAWQADNERRSEDGEPLNYFIK